jgi:hypothetical protein
LTIPAAAFVETPSAILPGANPMKRIASFLLFLGVALVAVSAARSQEACSLTVRDRSGSSVGRIDADGTFRDRSGSSVGRFGQGTVRDRSGSSIGRVDGDGTVRDRSGSSIGRVEGDGTLRDRSGSSTGRIDADGTVRDRSGSSSGRFDGYVPACRHAAAAFLFFFEPLHHR